MSEINEVASPGGKMGARIGRLLSDSHIYTKQRTQGMVAGTATTVLTDFTNHVSDEIRSVMGDLFRRVAAEPDTPDELRALFHNLGNARGQAWAWIAGTATGAAMGGGLIDLLTNYLNPVIGPTIAKSPHGFLDPNGAATAAARGIDTHLNLAYEAAQQGINSVKFNALIELARNAPPASQVLDMVNRGLMNEGEARRALIRSGIHPSYVDDVLRTRHIPLTPEQAAAAWARSLMSTEDVHRIAALSGVDVGDADKLMGLAGEPPSPEELLFAWRRGIIQESDVDRGIIQGPIRNEWLSVIKALQWIPLPVQEAANAVNQGHLELGAAQQVAEENGIRAEDFAVIVANAGIPPGPQEALDWVNRGIISDAEFRGIFLESRIKNKYIDLYLESRHEVMPPETIRLMYARNSLSKQDALKRLQQRGYTAEDAAIIINGASAEKTATVRDLTLSQVMELYATRAFTRDDALGLLGALGYDAEESVTILELADLRRVQRFMTAAVNRVHSAYLAGRISENDAVGQLDQLGMPAEQRDDALTLWQVERTTVSKGLTPAQIVAAVKKNLITAEDALARLTGQGYGEDDARTLLALSGVET